MTENFIEGHYTLEKKSKLKKFYESNKIFIFSTIFIIIITIVSFSFYFDNKEKKSLLLSDDYVQAKIYLEKGDRIEATNLLEKMVLANNSTYSTLALFLIINQNLISDHKKLNNLFEHLLTKNKFEDEVRNLLIFKKALLNSNFANESELIESDQPLLNEDTLWKAHVLILLGDYFVSKNENIKAKEFYIKVLNIKGVHKDLQDQARLQLTLIAND